MKYFIVIAIAIAAFLTLTACGHESGPTAFDDSSRIAQPSLDGFRIISPRDGDIIIGPTIRISWTSSENPVAWPAVWVDGTLVLASSETEVKVSLEAGDHQVKVDLLVHDGKSGPIESDTVNFVVVPRMFLLK